jgi:hypothetical protein
MMQQQAPNRPLAPALLELFGWFGFLGIGYMMQRRYGVGVAMLIGWWAVFWMLLMIGFASFGLGHLLVLCVWFVVPPTTAAFLYFEN